MNVTVCVCVFPEQSSRICSDGDGYANHVSHRTNGNISFSLQSSHTPPPITPFISSVLFSCSPQWPPPIISVFFCPSPHHLLLFPIFLCHHHITGNNGTYFNSMVWKESEMYRERKLHFFPLCFSSPIILSSSPTHISIHTDCKTVQFLQNKPKIPIIKTAVCRLHLFLGTFRLKPASHVSKYLLQSWEIRISAARSTHAFNFLRPSRQSRSRVARPLSKQQLYSER